MLSWWLLAKHLVAFRRTLFRGTQFEKLCAISCADSYIDIFIFVYDAREVIYFNELSHKNQDGGVDGQQEEELVG